MSTTSSTGSGAWPCASRTALWWNAITVHELPLAELADRAAAGMLVDAKTLILVQALLLRRPELFAR
ncbi:hypothetical protein [Sphingomonas aracearum]|uniref:hypothetical protein n=1 Tax=Sphingomonas aracearum TaxID=2283317 RepID=UPI0015F1204E|nr:hypothetical protein [Sphingomonas aracearum]